MGEDFFARIRTYQSLSLLEMTQVLTELHGINAAVAELDAPLVERIDNVLNQKGYPVKFSDIGHIAMVSNYLNKMGINLGYGTMDTLSSILEEAKQDMRQGEILYQLCSEKNRSRVAQILSEQGFSL